MTFTLPADPFLVGQPETFDEVMAKSAEQAAEAKAARQSVVNPSKENSDA